MHGNGCNLCEYRFDDDMITLTNEERGSRMLAFVCNVERLLGAASGSLMDVIQMFGGGDESSHE